MSHRIKRINQLIRQEISELLQRNVKDPRLGNFIAVTDVATSADLKHARIFVSCICTDEEKHEVMSGLTAASGFLRNELMKRLSLRRIPDLTFQWDDSIERGTHLLELIDKVSTDTHPD